MIITERPGFGASTPQPGRRFADHADDLVAIIDSLGIDSLPVHAGSGGAPYALALAARHPDRISAVTIVVGLAPMGDDEAAGMIGMNAAGFRLAKAADRDGMSQLLGPAREAMLADPLAGFRAIMKSAPEADQAIMGDPQWQALFVKSAGEAVRNGVDGWVDESMLMFGPWPDIDLAKVTTSVTWWHGDNDRNVPVSAVKRFLQGLPNARLVIWTDAGHLTPYVREAEILDELLARAEPA
jgi:pimeloyl-ACP methyl ester carboxylesterase